MAGKRFPTARSNARPKRFFNGVWYAPDGRGRWRSMYATPSYRFLHRAVWEHHRGAIPKGCRITPKDGNYGNCAIANLRCERVLCPWERYRRGLRQTPPADPQRAKRIAATRAFWARMSADERELYGLFRALARLDGQRERADGRKLLMMTAAAGAIHGHAH